MATTILGLKFTINDLSARYEVVGKSDNYSFSYDLGKGEDLVEDSNNNECNKSIDLLGNYGLFNVRVFAETSLGIRSQFVEDNVVIGGNSAVQQFTRIGQMAMIGGMTGVLHDVISYGLSIGNRNYLQGLNLIGLRRANFENKDILGLTEAYKEIFATKNLKDNLSKLNGEFKENPLVKNVIEFITKDKKRSICTPFSNE